MIEIYGVVMDLDMACLICWRYVILHQGGVLNFGDTKSQKEGKKYAKERKRRFCFP